MNETFVYIRRKPSKNFANKDLKLMDDNSSKYMGSAGYKGTSLPITGLTEVEKHFIMPSLVQLANTHNEFDLKVNDYFHDLREQVPAGKGLKLNVTTSKKQVTYAGEKTTIEFPVNPRDYVLYKRAIDPAYKQCADAEEHTSGSRVKFYVFDVKKAQEVEAKLGDVADDAYDAYLKISDKPELWGNILLVYGYNPDLLSKQDQKKRLRLLAVADGIKDSKERLEHLESFKNLVGDKEIELKATIKKLINADQIKVEGTSYIYNNDTTSVVIAKSEEGAVAWFKDVENNKDVISMKAKAGI